jgi:hypothetical protein
MMDKFHFFEEKERDLGGGGEEDDVLFHISYK